MGLEAIINFFIQGSNGSLGIAYLEVVDIFAILGKFLVRLLVGDRPDELGLHQIEHQ